jgi:regulator of cell morphogenesis and NO signaling
MIIKENHPMAEAVLENHQLIALLPRFKIPLGFGEKTVRQVCEEHHVSPGFFLEIVNAKISDDFQSSTALGQYPVPFIVDYLKNTHGLYLENDIPRIEEHIHQLIHTSSMEQEKKKLVVDFFNDYKNEFIEHVNKEEYEVLPYSLQVDEQAKKKVPDSAFVEKIRKNSIDKFAREHDRLEDALQNLAKLIVKYLAPFEDRVLCNSFLSQLFTLHDDLIDHAQIEDLVLVPRIAELERSILEKSSK